MKGLNLLFFILLIAALNSYAENFLYKETVVESEVTNKIVDCGNYQIRLETEKFPFEYEAHIPSKFKIEGFLGSPTTIRKVAFVQPKEILISQPEQISDIKSQIPKNRTYLPTSAVCK